MPASLASFEPNSTTRLGSFSKSPDRGYTDDPVLPNARRSYRRPGRHRALIHTHGVGVSGEAGFGPGGRAHSAWIASSNVAIGIIWIECTQRRASSASSFGTRKIWAPA